MLRTVPCVKCMEYGCVVPTRSSNSGAKRRPRSIKPDDVLLFSRAKLDNISRSEAGNISRSLDGSQT